MHDSADLQSSDLILPKKIRKIGNLSKSGAKPVPGLLWNPYFQIFIATLLNSASQLWLKVGAEATAPTGTLWNWLGLTELASFWTWLGIASLCAGFGSWLYALRFLPLGLAFGLGNGVHIFVPLGAWLFLHEYISPLRILGIVVILAGILLLAQSVANAEEKV